VGDEEEILTTEAFFLTCKLVGLTIDDMQVMTIGNCLDYATDYIDLKQSEGKEKPRIRKAKQSDFDNF